MKRKTNGNNKIDFDYYREQTLERRKQLYKDCGQEGSIIFVHFFSSVDREQELRQQYNHSLTINGGSNSKTQNFKSLLAKEREIIVGLFKGIFKVNFEDSKKIPNKVIDKLVKLYLFKGEK